MSLSKIPPAFIGTVPSRGARATVCRQISPTQQESWYILVGWYDVAGNYHTETHEWPDGETAMKRAAELVCSKLTKASNGSVEIY